MIPTGIIGLLIVIVAVLPGSMYTWAYERESSAFGVTAADRTLRFIAVSLIFHLVLGWPEYLLYRAAFTRHHFASGQFAAAWAAALIVIGLPALIGSVLGGLYATRSSRRGWTRLRRRLNEGSEARLLRVMLGRDPAPRAWDDLFCERPSVYIRVRTAGGSWLAGLFAENSYAGGFPNDTDLLLEEAWDIDETNGQLRDRGLGYAVYVPASQIAWLEILDPTEPAKVVNTGV